MILRQEHACWSTCIFTEASLEWRPALQEAESHRDKAQIATKVIKAIVTLFIQWYHRDQQMMWHILQFCFLLLVLSVAAPSASTAPSCFSISFHKQLSAELNQATLQAGSILEASS